MAVPLTCSSHLARGRRSSVNIPAILHPKDLDGVATYVTRLQRQLWSLLMNSRHLHKTLQKITVVLCLPAAQGRAARLAVASSLGRTFYCWERFVLYATEAQRDLSLPTFKAAGGSCGGSCRNVKREEKKCMRFTITAVGLQTGLHGGCLDHGDKAVKVHRRIFASALG